jgi:hypothetical protein
VSDKEVLMRWGGEVYVCTPIVESLQSAYREKRGRERERERERKGDR